VIKILLKSAALVFIILSVYFIVHPSACSNFLAGRVAVPTTDRPAVEEPAGPHGTVLTPVGDEPLQPANQVHPEDELLGGDGRDTLPEDEYLQPVEQTAHPQAEETLAATTYSQEEIDYAIARRYVELENEYIKAKKMGKDTAKEIAYIVMDDFEMTQQEWESFLQRATEDNLFARIRKEILQGK